MKTQHRTRISIVAVGLVLAACSDTVQGPEEPPAVQFTPGFERKVVLFVIDGARYSETFGDTTHAYIPHLWNDLAPQGTLITNFRNSGVTKTVPGHASLLTGTWQSLLNDGTERPDQPTVFEYFRQNQSIPMTKTYIVSGKPKLAACSYSTHPSWGSAWGATADMTNSDDNTTYAELMSVMTTEQPRLVLAALPSVDTGGHSGVWSNYIAAIENVDSLVWDFWNFLETDPYYAGQTWMFITNDHGRHDDLNGGFQNHGDSCEGCQHIMFLVLGPNIRAGHTVTNTYNLRDICTTVGEILEFPATNSQGFVIGEIFEPVTTGILEAATGGAR